MLVNFSDYSNLSNTALVLLLSNNKECEEDNSYRLNVKVEEHQKTIVWADTLKLGMAEPMWGEK